MKLTKSITRKIGTVAAGAAAMAIVAVPAMPAQAAERTVNPPGACSAMRISGFEYYGAGSSGVRDGNNDCGAMTPNVTWNSYAQGTNRTYCGSTTSNYKRCVGSGDWVIAHGGYGGSFWNLNR